MGHEKISIYALPMQFHDFFFDDHCWYKLILQGFNFFFQNVPVPTAKDMADQVKLFCEGKLELTGFTFLKQDNISQKHIASDGPDGYKVHSTKITVSIEVFCSLSEYEFATFYFDEIAIRTYSKIFVVKSQRPFCDFCNWTTFWQLCTLDCFKQIVTYGANLSICVEFIFLFLPENLNPFRPLQGLPVF